MADYNIQKESTLHLKTQAITTTTTTATAIATTTTTATTTIARPIDTNQLTALLPVTVMTSVETSVASSAPISEPSQPVSVAQPDVSASVETPTSGVAVSATGSGFNGVTPAAATTVATTQSVGPSVGNLALTGTNPEPLIMVGVLFVALGAMLRRMQRLHRK